MPTDDVRMEYRVLGDEDNVGLEKVFESQGRFIEKALRRPVDKHVVTEVGGEIDGVNGVKDDVIVEEEQEVQKARFMLRLVKI